MAPAARLNAMNHSANRLPTARTLCPHAFMAMFFSVARDKSAHSESALYPQRFIAGAAGVGDS